jgi:hypothetical protein
MWRCCSAKWKKALLFEKRSKNFCQLLPRKLNKLVGWKSEATSGALQIPKVFASFFKKKCLLGLSSRCCINLGSTHIATSAQGD